jgi:hypothetical protein
MNNKIRNLFLTVLSIAMLFTLSTSIVTAEGNLKTNEFINDHSQYKDLKLEIEQLPNDKVLLRATVEWKKIPEVRGWDILGIGFDANQIKYRYNISSITGTQSYKAQCKTSDGVKVNSGTFTYTSEEEEKYFHINKEGIAFKHNLKDDWQCNSRFFFFDDYYEVTELTQTLQFIIEKSDDRVLEFLDVTAFYTHMVKDNAIFNRTNSLIPKQSQFYIAEKGYTIFVEEDFYQYYNSRVQKTKGQLQIKNDE